MRRPRSGGAWWFRVLICRLSGSGDFVDPEAIPPYRAVALRRTGYSEQIALSAHLVYLFWACVAYDFFN